MDPGLVANILGPIFEGLRESGVEPSVSVPGEGAVVITLVVGVDACSECILPDEHLERVVRYTLETNGVACRYIRIIKREERS
jgi:hypothetical protein